VELESPELAELAVRNLNNQFFNGSRLIVCAATALRKLFVGNIERTVNAAMLHNAISTVAAVRAAATSGRRVRNYGMRPPPRAWLCLAPQCVWTPSAPYSTHHFYTHPVCPSLPRRA
jgi:hypothetical protein